MMDRSKFASVISERLSKLRESSGKTRPELREELKNRYGDEKDFISKDALLNYEGSGLYSSRDGKAAGMSVTTLVAFAEYYNVSTDYILGLREEKTPDASKQGVCETTGLSEDAVNWICGLDAVSIQYLDMILNNDTFKKIFGELHNAPILTYRSKTMRATVDDILSFDDFSNDDSSLTLRYPFMSPFFKDVLMEKGGDKINLTYEKDSKTIDNSTADKMLSDYYEMSQNASLVKEVAELRYTKLASTLYDEFSSLEDFPELSNKEAE